MRSEMGAPLSRDEARDIKDSGERTFVEACLNVGCLVFYQIDVGNSVIDFLVFNPKNPNSEGKLVEVTMEPREDIDRNFIKKGKGSHKKRVVNTTGLRKRRQIESMKESGRPWTILCREELSNLMQGH